MTLTASDVVSLTVRMEYWEYAEYTFAGLVAVACFGEYIADFTKWWRRDGIWSRLGPIEERKDNLGKLSTLLLITALVAETVCLFRTNQISGQVLGSLNELSDEAFKKGVQAKEDAGTAITQSGQAVTKAGLAEGASGRAIDKSNKAEGTASTAMVLAKGARQEADSFEKDIKDAKRDASEAKALLAEVRQLAAETQQRVAKVQEVIADRHITEQQQREIRKALAGWANIELVITLVNADRETEGFAKDLLSTFGPMPGWAAEISEIGTNSGTSGISVILEQGASDKEKVFASALAEALRAGGINVNGPIPPVRYGTFTAGGPTLWVGRPVSRGEHKVRIEIGKK